jgi:hypothetical protein
MPPEKSHVNGGIQKMRRKWNQKLYGGEGGLTEHVPNINRPRSNVTQHHKQYSARFTPKPKIAWEEIAHSPILQFALIIGWKEGGITWKSSDILTLRQHT